MSGFAAGLAGLSNVAPGYLAQQGTYADNQLKNFQVQEAQNELAGGSLAGAALQLLAGGGQPPAAPMPGQASAPGSPGGAPPPPGAYNLQGGPTQPPMMPGRPQAPAPQAAPGAPAGRPPAPMPAGGMPAQAPSAARPGQPPAPTGQPQGQPTLDLQTIINAVVKASGGKASPAVIAAAVNKFLPLMNAQAQQQWREMSLALREQQLTNLEQYRQTQQSGVQGRFDTREERLNRQFDMNTNLKMRRLDQLDQQYKLALQRNDLNTAKTIADLAHKQSIEVIQAWGASNNVDQKTIDDMLMANAKEYAQLKAQLEKGQMPTGSPSAATPAGPGQGGVRTFDPKTGTFK